jgi:hypothetical protein
MPHVRSLIALVALILPGPPVQADDVSPLNAEVMRLIAGYPEKGFGGYTWPARRGTHGTTRDLFHGKSRIARAGDGNHCVGITFEVMWRALSTRPAAQAQLTAAQAKHLRTLWFVPADGGMGPAEALATYGLGRRIADWSEARPGDFVQLWNKDRTLGHSVVFIDWMRGESEAIVGIRYWSSQPWTEGIGFSTFSIGHAPGDMDPASVFIARLVQHKT